MNQDYRIGKNLDRSMGEIARVCVYCGSSPGNDPDFMRAATRFGEILADNGVGLVYGGGAPRVMGAVAPPLPGRGGGLTRLLPGIPPRRGPTFTGAPAAPLTPH